MSTTTGNLGLFKYDTTLDSQQPFNIDTALNGNWDILDNLIATKTWVNNQGFLKSHQSLANYAPKANPTLTGTVKVPNSATVGTAVSTAGISKAADGYIKFGNGIIIQWGYLAANTTTYHGGRTINLPTGFSNKNYQLAFGLYTKNSGAGVDFQDVGFASKTTTSFNIRMESTTYVAGCSWIAIGY